MPSEILYTIKLPSKVSDQQLGEIVNDVFEKFRLHSLHQGIFIFDLSDLKWIGNQELLVISGILETFAINQINFRVLFTKHGTISGLKVRQARQIVEIWEVWKIYSIVDQSKLHLHFDIDGKIVAELKKHFDVKYDLQKIYDRFEVTPLIELPQIKNYDDRQIGEMLGDVYRLNAATNEILRSHNCILPFDNKTISAIITKELYENFLDHASISEFGNIQNLAFMSVSLIPSFKGSPQEIQQKQRQNFNQESFSQFKDFYYDLKNERFKNQSILQLSFTDFGQGISKTLLPEYKRISPRTFDTNHYLQNQDTRVLEYAFLHDSSKDPIHKRYLNRSIVPRGLFDLLTIVRRFGGMLTARSNYGKVFYDFSNNKSFNDAIGYFSDDRLYYPGTLITIYIPERAVDNAIDSTLIKPVLPDQVLISDQKEIRQVSLFQLQKALMEEKLSKSELYDKLFERLIKLLAPLDNPSLIYLDFYGYEIDERVSRKIIHFVTTDYSINNHNSIIIINPPPLSFLEEMTREIADLAGILFDYKVHPTPFIYFDETRTDISIYWIGVSSDEDIKKLNDLLFDIHDLSQDTFSMPNSVVGNINYYDKHGNLHSSLNRPKLLSKISEAVLTSRFKTLEKIISAASLSDPNQIYLCNGNYYQYEYLQLSDVLDDHENGLFLASSLYLKMFSKFSDVSTYKYLSITTNSQKITNHLINAGLIQSSQVVSLDNYHAFEDEESFNRNIVSGDKVIVICDITSTGHLHNKIKRHLNEGGAELVQVCVIVNALDEDFEKEERDYEDIKSSLTALIDRRIKKFRREDVIDKLIADNTEVIRINPYTNSPILEFLNKELFDAHVLLSNQEFVDLVKDEHIKVGYYKFNNLIHPYFFDMDKIIADTAIGQALLREIFTRMDQRKLEKVETIYYPKNSAIQFLDPSFLRNEIIKNQRLMIYEMERFPTIDGWRFPHFSGTMARSLNGKHVMILDDGSCSGDSIIQMIDEVASQNISSILVLSIIGRVNDHKRDFFSRLKLLQTKDKVVEISVQFGCHWHVPTYYLQESPVLKEKRWLEEISSYRNMPDNIKVVVENVLGELAFKKTNETNNKYLLKSPHGELIKNLILTKENIGKVTNYVFFRDYFEFANQIIKHYETQTVVVDRYKEIELICEIFLHEPYLFEKVKTVLPDLTGKIEEFIQTILFGNPRKKGKPQLSLSSLTYKWSRKDVLHLLFIVFRDEALFELLDSNSLAKLVREFCQKDSELVYLFYRLIEYLPLRGVHAPEKIYAGKVRNLIHAVIDTHELSPDAMRLLKRFRGFIATLPYDMEDFDSRLSIIHLNYLKLTDEKFHKESLTVQRDIIDTQLELLSIDYTEETEKTVIQTWEKISPFLEELLSFSKSFKNYFAPGENRIYGKLELQSNSLRDMHGEVSELMFSLNPSTDIKRIQDLVIKMYQDFVASQSDYFKIFYKINTSNVYERFGHLRKKLLEGSANIQILQDGNLDNVYPIAIPEFFMDEIMMGELLNNFRHCDTSEPIYIEWGSEGQYLTFQISNKARVISKEEHGSGSGLLKLERLNEMPNALASYEYDLDKNDYFIQKFKFKKI